MRQLKMHLVYYLVLDGVGVVVGSTLHNRVGPTDAELTAWHVLERLASSLTPPPPTTATPRMCVVPVVPRREALRGIRLGNLRDPLTDNMRDQQSKAIFSFFFLVVVAVLFAVLICIKKCRNLFVCVIDMAVSPWSRNRSSRSDRIRQGGGAAHNRPPKLHQHWTP